MSEQNPEPNIAANDAAWQEALDGEETTGDLAEEEQACSPAQLRQAEERVLRAQAELENFRKRARRELEEALRYAQLPLISDLLPVLDNLDRAIGAAEEHESAAGLLEGVKMVADQLLDLLAKSACQRIKDLGEPFDPNQHEAIGQEASSEYAAGTVSRVTRTGYRLHDRIVRPSQVMISTGPPSDELGSDPGENANA